MELTKNQRSIFDFVENSDGNCLITGPPGCGKSVLINFLVNEGVKSYALAAPTGLAAINIGGKTIHSLFALPISQGIISPDYDKYTDNENIINYIRFHLKHLIIDEISMVRCDMFDYIDRMLKHIKGNDKPFGGVQMILVGDFYQLPPIVKREDQKELFAAGYESPFVFSAKSFNGFTILQLNEVLRQKGDKKFIDLLWNVRGGDLQAKDLVQLNSKVQPIADTDLRIRLCCLNKESDAINAKFMAKIQERPTCYVAVEYGNWPAYPVEKILSLKVGAQVMVKKNKADIPNATKGARPEESKVVNGTLGIITELLEDRVKIKLPDDVEVFIYKKRWERKKKVRGEDGKWTEEVLASYEQIPLQLAWSISIHKSQGQSFTHAHINPAKVFAAGQFYVALSRVRTLAGVTFETRVSRDHCWTDEMVEHFNLQINGQAKV